MQHTEHPVRFLGEVARVATENTAGMIAEGIQDHEDRMHIPPRRTDPVQAVPFANERIPDVELAAMIELMETEGISLQEAAYRFHRPWHLVERSMADYQPQWRRFLMQRMAG